MNVGEWFQRIWRRAELNLPSPSEILRRMVWQLRGARIGRGTRLPACRVTWPHQVSIGGHCELHPGVFFNYSHYWTPGPSIVIGDHVLIGAGVEFNCRSRITIGNRCLIAAGSRLIDSNHGMAAAEAIANQDLDSDPITLEEGVWLGANVIVLKGVHLGAGAVIGAGSVVTHSVPAGEVWAGVPARRIRRRH